MKTIRDKLLELTDAKTMKKLETYGFDLAYEEADFLGLPRVGEPFDKMVLIRQNIVIHNVYEVVRLSVKKGERFKIIIPKEEELLEIVRRQYGK